MSRRTRILVPVDVQAYVVPEGGAEETVAVTGDVEQGPGAVRGRHAEGARGAPALGDAGRAAPRRPRRGVPLAGAARAAGPVGRRPHPPAGRASGRCWPPAGWSTPAPHVVTPLPAFTGPATGLRRGRARPDHGLHVRRRVDLVVRRVRPPLHLPRHRWPTCRHCAEAAQDRLPRRPGGLHGGRLVERRVPRPAHRCPRAGRARQRPGRAGLAGRPRRATTPRSSRRTAASSG